MQGKYELGIHDCNEALRQYPTFVDASLLRYDQLDVWDVRGSVEGVELRHFAPPSACYPGQSLETTGVVAGKLPKSSIS